MSPRIRSIARLAVVACAATFATFVYAQPKPALVKDVDQPARSMYQETVNVPSDCFGQFSCEVIFSTVPAGKRLVVTRVNAIYTLSSTSGDSNAVLGTQPPSAALWLQPGPNAAPSFTRTLNTATLLYADAGAFPAMFIRTESVFNGNVVATLSGYYVSVP